MFGIQYLRRKEELRQAQLEAQQRFNTLIGNLAIAVTANTRAIDALKIDEIRQAAITLAALERSREERATGRPFIQ